MNTINKGMKIRVLLVFFSLCILSLDVIGRPGGGRHHGSRGRHGSSRYHGGRRGGYGRRHHRSGYYGRGLGLGLGLGRRHGGFAIGFDTGLWDRPGWRDWRGSYWGSDGRWLDYRSDWRGSHNWPRISNETGERIKFYVSERRGSRYTLTVVTEAGQTKTFPELEIPAMANVEVLMDKNGELQIAPR